MNKYGASIRIVDMRVLNYHKNKTMKKRFLMIPLLIICLELSAERIDGPANIRREPQGEKFISLYDSVEVTCTEIENNWYQIGFNVRLTKEQYEQQKITIPAGTELYNLNDELIGEALIDLIFINKSSGGPKENKWYATEFVGYTYISNIKPLSIPENRLREILINNKKNVAKSDLRGFINQFDFQESGLLDRFDKEFEEYMIHENWIDDPSPMDRIRLILKDSELIAIVHTRDLKISYLNSIELVRGRWITIIQDMSDEEKQEFLNMNKKSYAGID